MAEEDEEEEELSSRRDSPERLMCSEDEEEEEAVRLDSARRRPGRGLRQLRAGCHLLLALQCFHGDGEAVAWSYSSCLLQHGGACPPPVLLQLHNRLKPQITALPAGLIDNLLPPVSGALSYELHELPVVN